MIRQAKIKTVTAGGRPNKNPIAVIGGTQGAQVSKFDDVKVLASVALDLVKEKVFAAFKDDAVKFLGPLVQPAPVKVNTEVSQFNFRDNIAQGDQSFTPLQFSSVKAECRFFYMPADILNVTNTWKRVIRGLSAGGKGLCINGNLTGSPATGSSIEKPTIVNSTISGASFLAPYAGFSGMHVGVAGHFALVILAMLVFA